MPHFSRFQLFPVILLLDQRSIPADGAWNMACDEALLGSSGESGIPILRLYAWDRPTLSFGYFLRHADAAAAAAPEEPVIRRWTGGGLVHHGSDLTWSLLVPRGHPFALVRPAESYGQLHDAVAAALLDLEVSQATVVPASAPAPRDGLCFDAPAPGDLLLDGCKIAGAGQRRTRQGLLHQASLRLPGQELPESFGRQLAGQLAREVILFEVPVNLEIPRARYADPGWVMRI